MNNRIIISFVTACAILSFVLFGERTIASSEGITVKETIKYNKANKAYFFDLIKTTDGFIAVGLDDLSVDDEISTKALIVKYDNNGNLEWEDTLNASEIDAYKSIIETEDGFIVVGYSMFTDNHTELRKNKDKENRTSDIALIHYSKDGKILDIKSFGGTNDDYINKIIKVTDGFLLVGESASNDIDLKSKNYGLTDAIIVKYNFDLSKEWTINFGGTLRDTLSDLIVLEDIYVAVGSTYSKDYDLIDKNNGEEDALIIGVSPDGKIEWSETIGGTVQDGFIDIVPHSKGVVATGYTLSNDIDFEGKNPSGYTSLFTTFSLDGTFLDVKTNDQSGSSYYPINVYEDGYLSAGTSNNNNIYQNLFTKYNSNGEKEWEINFPGIELGGIENFILIDDEILAIEYRPEETNFIFLQKKSPDMTNSQVIISIIIVLIIIFGTIFLYFKNQNKSKS